MRGPDFGMRGAFQIAGGATVTAAIVIARAVVTRRRSHRCGSQRCCPDRRSAIRIIPPTVSSATVSSAAIGGPAPPRNGTTSDTYRASPSGVNTGTATTVGERVVGNKGCAEKCGGC